MTPEQQRLIDDPAAWDTLVAAQPAAAPCQLSAWARLKEAYGYRSLRLALEREAGPPVLGQVLIRRIVPLGGDWLYCPYGPLVKPDDAAGLQAWVRALLATPAARRAAVLTLEPRLASGAPAIGALVEGCAFRPARQSIQPRGTFLLDLQPAVEELRAGMERRTRYNVGLAERRGVEVRLQNDAAGVDVFCDLLEETAERQRFLAHDRDYYHRVWRGFGSEGADILLAYFDGEPVAGVFLLYAGSNAYYVYGASSHRHAKQKGTQYVQWRAVQRARERGAELYDFWGAPVEPTKDHPLWGVYKFKKGFGGEHTVFCGPHERALTLWGGFAWRHGLPLVRRLRNLLVRGRTADVLD